MLNPGTLRDAFTAGYRAHRDQPVPDEYAILVVELALTPERSMVRRPDSIVPNDLRYPEGRLI